MPGARARDSRSLVGRRWTGGLVATVVLLGVGCGSRIEPSIRETAATTTAPPSCPERTIKPAVSAGWYTNCAVTSAGAAVCWGSNSTHELGNGLVVDDSPVPVDVVGLSSGVAAVSAGEEHACAVTTAGAVKCWGANTNGELGDGSTTDSAVPVDVVGLSSGVVAVSAGNWATCALTAAGAVKCWGANAVGELGNGSTMESHVPVDVVGLSSGVCAISMGGDQTCALTAAGAVKCWGTNEDGQLGNGSLTDSSVPVDVVGLSSGVVSLSAGWFFTCAVTAGAVECWGSGPAISDIPGSTVPAPVMSLASGVVAVSAGGAHACALTAAGGVECWGYNDYGQLGTGGGVASLVPVDVVGLSSGVRAVSAGMHHTCALTETGGVRCWGGNSSGQLGNGSTIGSPVPVDVVGL